MFEKGKEYHRRSDIHAAYGGQEQGGISTPSKHPYIFLFSAETGEQFGYNDGWIDTDRHTLFRYSGEGQRGDMTMTRGNRAIRDHAENGKQLHLFQRSRHGYYRYLGEFEYVSHLVEERTVDADGRTRQAIVFMLRRVDER